MQTKKMSLANMQGKLSRAEMKKIMAGSGDVILCGGTGNYVEKCACVGSSQTFYCCHLTLSTCISANGCGPSGWGCSH